MEEFSELKGTHPDFDTMLTKVSDDLAHANEANCRRLTEDLAKLAASAIFLKSGPDLVAGAYIETRLTGQSGDCYGTLPDGIDTRALVERALPL